MAGARHALTLLVASAYVDNMNSELEQTAKKLLEKSAKEMTDKQVSAFRMGAAWLVYRIRAEMPAGLTVNGDDQKMYFKVDSEWLGKILG